MKRISLITGMAWAILLLVVAQRMPPYSQWTIDDGVKRLASSHGKGYWAEFLPDGPVRSRLTEPARFAPLQPPFAIRTEHGMFMGFAPLTRTLFSAFFDLRPPVRQLLLAIIAISVWVGLEAAGVRFAFLLLPLTFYGLTHWEHALSWALCLPAILMLLARTDEPRVDRPASPLVSLSAAGAGLLLGLAALLRSETLILAAALVVFAAIRRRALGLALGGGVAITIAVFWIVHSLTSESSALIQFTSNWSGVIPNGSFGRWCAERVSAAYVLLLRSADDAAASSFLIALLFGGTWLLYRGERHRATSGMIVGIALIALWATIYHYRLWSAPIPPIEVMYANSMLTSFPWVLALWRAPCRERPALTLGVFAILATLVVTPVWEGVHWGPRVLLFIMPVLALDLFRSGRARGITLVVLLVLSGIQQVSSAALVYARGREVSDRVVLAERHLGAVVVCHTMSQCVDYAALWPEREFFVAGTPRELRQLLIDLRRAEVDTVWMHTEATDSLYQKTFPDSKPAWPQRITSIQAKSLYRTYWRIYALVMNRHDPHWSEVLQQEAGRRMLEGNPEDALPLQQEAVLADPGCAPCHHNLAVLLSQLGRTEEARQEAEIARQLDPSLIRPQW